MTRSLLLVTLLAAGAALPLAAQNPDQNRAQDAIRIGITYRPGTQPGLVVVPGPGEVDIVRQWYPDVLAFEGVDLGVYAGILRRARLVVANDTGPAHIAASVGAPLLSVLGPTDAARHRPWGSHVTIVQQTPWPTLEHVAAEARRLLDDVPRPPS